MLANGHCTVYFFDNIQEETRQRDNEESQIIYKYDMYVIDRYYRENLKADIEENYQVWLDFAKQTEYDELAKEARAKRDELLAETDKEMVLDRLQLTIPEKDLTITNIVEGIKDFFTSLKNIFNSEMAQYRQKLRDIPQQEKFPYNITWPEKPKTNDKDKEGM